MSNYIVYTFSYKNQ